MSVVLDVTDTITFNRPLTRINKQSIRIENTHAQPVAFKVKTTAPKIYCVRPNADIIPANSAVDIQIMHQAFKEEPAANVKCKDKFLILSTFITEQTANMNLNELWAYAEEKDKSNIHQHKLRCVYGEVAPSAAETVAQAEPVETNRAVPVVTNNESSPAVIAEDNEEEVREKLKQMEDELSKYKDEVKSLREKDTPVVVEKTQIVKQSSNPFSIIILLALFVAAVAYFVKA